MTGPRSTRRLFLASGVAALAGLAGCGSGDGSDGRATADSPTGTETDASPTATPTATDSPTPTASPTPTSGEPAIAHPGTVVVDEPFALDLSGVRADDVDVVVETTDANGNTWTSSATFRAAGAAFGLDEATLVDGPFTDELAVPDTMALLQFLGPTGDPVPYRPEPAETLSVTASAGGTELASTSITRHHGGPEVSATPVEHDRLAGTLYEPPVGEPTPGVVVLHASDGRPDRFVAEMLATNGFTALALRYFGNGTPHEQLFEVPVEYVGTAVGWLLDRDGVAGERVGLVGDSKGAELALLAGSEFDTVGPVVSRNGSGVVWPGFSSEGLNAGSSWTVDGTGVPFVPYVEDRELWSKGKLEPAFTASLDGASDEQIENATIPVEEVEGPLLFISGGEDAVWDSRRLQGIAVDRLENAGRSDFDHLVYGNAGHVTTVPYRPVAKLEARTRLVVGGTPAGHATASADHWPRLLKTLETLR